MARDGVDDGTSVRETVVSVLSGHPVEVGFLFGSRAREDAHEHSDVDLAVTFERLEPGDPGYNDALFGLSADLASALNTDDLDVIDLERASPALVRTVLDEGVQLVGTDREVRELREQLRARSEETEPDRSPAERFDDVLAAIEDHLA